SQGRPRRDPASVTNAVASAPGVPRVNREIADMDLEAFRRTLAGPQPPALPAPLRALWHSARGEWDRAHAIVQEEDDRDSAWVHAYLHRVEGDLSNARYWYARAQKPPCKGALEDEWNELASALLDALEE
ncbi:MAG TPA: hypothetical protein VFU53_08395, partial [Burkholderiales bacterium]|nr:hypothetical protein [Burkholderiales bacterium]